MFYILLLEVVGAEAEGGGSILQYYAFDFFTFKTVEA